MQKGYTEAAPNRTRAGLARFRRECALAEAELSDPALMGAPGESRFPEERVAGSRGRRILHLEPDEAVSAGEHFPGAAR